MLNQVATALSSSVCGLVENLRACFAQKTNASHVALTALFQASGIRLSRRRARRAKTSVSVYAAPTEDNAGINLADDVMVFANYG
jgi:hypothetical protein